MSNVKQLGLATLMYAEDYDERFPPASNWQAGALTYTKSDKIFHCPSASPATGQSGAPAGSYAFNSALNRMKQARMAEPKTTVLLYDSTDLRPNANDALTSLPSPGRHHQRNNVGFADGHVQVWPDSEPLPQGKILPDSL